MTAGTAVLGSYHDHISHLHHRPDSHFANNEVAECADDKEVVEKALAQANGCAIEIWNNARFVMRLPGDASNGSAMAIYRLIANGSFGPAEVKAMTAAYEAALLDLGLVDRDDPITEIVATAIVSITSMAFAAGSGRAR